jgi:hypothetical protein
MSTSNARIGYGTILKRRISTSPLTYQTIMEVNHIGGPTMKRDTPDVTHMLSPEGFHEFIPGLKDGGEVTVEGNLVVEDATQNVSTGLLGEFFSDERTNFIIEFPGTGSPPVQWSFDAVMSGFDSNMPVDDKMTFTATLKVSGKPTLA